LGWSRLGITVSIRKEQKVSRNIPETPINRLNPGITWDEKRGSFSLPDSETGEEQQDRTLRV